MSDRNSKPGADMDGSNQPPVEAREPHHQPQPLSTADIDWGMDCNIEDPSDEEAHAFERGVRFAEWKHGIKLAATHPKEPTEAPAQKKGGA